MDWLTPEVVVGLLVAIHAAALTYINSTDTPKGDSTYAKVYRWIERLGGLLSDRAKQKDDK